MGWSGTATRCEATYFWRDEVWGLWPLHEIAAQNKKINVLKIQELTSSYKHPSEQSLYALFRILLLSGQVRPRDIPFPTSTPNPVPRVVKALELQNPNSSVKCYLPKWECIISTNNLVSQKTDWSPRLVMIQMPIWKREVLIHINLLHSVHIIWLTNKATALVFLWVDWCLHAVLERAEVQENATMLKRWSHLSNFGWHPRNRRMHHINIILAFFYGSKGSDEAICD